jgi:amyloid beta precursor protein binding protein 1
MHSSTSSYVALQNLYRAQFNQDLERFKRILADTLQRIGLPEDAIPGDEVEGFARNSGGVQVIKGRPLEDSKDFTGLTQEVYSEYAFVQANVGEQYGEESIHLGMHLAFLASERFYIAEGRWPGTTDATDLSEENSQVGDIATRLLKTALPMQELGTETLDSIAEV